MSSKDYLLVTDAAKLLGVSTQTLRNWSNQGHIPSTRHPLNGYRIFAAQDIAKLAQKLPLSPATVAEANEVDWDFPNSSPTESIHRFHSYPAKFIPEIPRALIELFPPANGSCIFDPFCGCGTTLVEAQQQGFESVGVDLNPIAVMISQVKTSTLPKDFTSEYIRVLNEATSLQTDPSYKEQIPNVAHWFKEDVSEELDRLRRAISTAPKRVRIFLNAALSSIVVRVSNQESDTRYAAVTKNVSAETVRSLFRTTCQRMASLWEFKGAGSPSAYVIQSDVRSLVPKTLPKPIGLTITSPPYPNAYEYWLYHKYRMYWLQHNPLAVKEREIGARAHYFKKEVPSDGDFLKVLKDLFLVTHARSIRNAYACVVIGRSVIHGRVVDNAAITIKAATEAGFSFVTRMDRKMNPNRKSFNLSHARIAKEDILIFQKT